MISQKIAGTYQDQNNQKPKYDFNVEDCIPEKTPQPRNYSPQSINQFDDTNQKQEQQKNFGRKSLISKQKKPANARSSRAGSRMSQRSDGKSMSARSNGSSRSNFCNYGNGNSTRLNPKFNHTSYNVGACHGVNPNTIIRSEGRAYALEKYGKPLDGSSRGCRPAFFESPNQAPEEIRSELEGPFWVTWPQNVPVPDDYAELRPIVALQP